MSRHQSPSQRRRRLVFVSHNAVWGGSEELWSATAAELAERGHEVAAITIPAFRDARSIKRLKAAGGRVHALYGWFSAPGKSRLLRFLAGRIQPLLLRLRLATVPRTDLVVISQGDNFAAHPTANACAAAGLPYALITQKAQEAVWTPDVLLGEVRRAYAGAAWSYFVSGHNLRLTEEQLGRSLLPRASVVRNPFLTSWAAPLTWPEESGAYRLACVGRLYPFEKGQDLLLRVLAAPKWRTRPLSVTFYGEGAYRRGLEDMARHLGLASVRFAGFAADVDAIWDSHHGLVLPSRGEGLPLVLVEAMLRGRVPVVTDVAGNAEVISDNVTGFVAAAAAATALDEALERAWARRAEWRAIGQAAAASIRTLVPRNPAAVFADELLRLHDEVRRTAADRTAER